ncbi:MAG: sigma D regulator [Gammaproteobacteria bacterium]|nr:MAG: sigma D regulator [Gammaproteobacteria bacterium]
MLENCKTAKERWGGVSEIIDRWLTERQDLIVQYYELVSGAEFPDVETAVATYRRFCQVLVDYVSAGHFEVYEQLVAEARAFNDGCEQVAHETLPAIQATTEKLLDFNDQFDQTPEEREALEALKPALAVLGEVLEDRFELEDMLIEKIHHAHASQVA